MAITALQKRIELINQGYTVFTGDVQCNHPVEIIVDKQHSVVWCTVHKQYMFIESGKMHKDIFARIKKLK